MAAPLDVQKPRDRQHLIEDAQLADELRVRYADFRHREPFGYEGHGGLLEQGKVANDCLARLDAIIQKNHGVTAQQIDDARKHRDPRFDLSVLISFALLYVLGALWTGRRLVRRFAPNGQEVVAVAAALTSVPASAIGVQLLVLWATTAEMLRVGNDHLGQRRGELIPWIHQLGAAFVAGIIIYGLAALFWSRRSSVDETLS